MERDLFLSHSNSPEDASLLRILQDLCALVGLELVVAENRYEGASSIGRKVGRLIDAASSFIVLYTKSAAASRWVSQEIGYAEKKDAFVILVEEGVEFEGFREFAEKIRFDRDCPTGPFCQAVRYLKALGEPGTEEVESSPVTDAGVLRTALSQTKKLLRPYTEKRVASFIEISAEHELIDHEGTPIVCCRVKMETELESSETAESWGFKTFAESSIREVLGESRKPWKVNAVEVGGAKLAPIIESVHGWEVRRFECTLPAGGEVTTLVDFEYKCWPEDVYYCQLSRFCKRIRIVYRKNDDFRFDTVEGGVAEPLHPPRVGPLRDSVKFERKGLLLPGWTYILYWRARQSAMAAYGKGN